MSNIKTRKTNRYNKFKSLKGNRSVIMAHVKALANAMKENDFSELIPVLINEKWEVIDGQHRIEALKILGKPIYYVVARGAKLEDVQALNNSTKNWRVKDYIDSYIELGNKEYEILASFMETYSLSASLSASLLEGTSERSATRIKDGTFKVISLKSAVDVGDFLSKVKKYVDNRVFQDRDFVTAIAHTLKQGVNKKRLLNKFTFLGMRIKREAKRDDYLRRIEWLYNFKSRNGTIRLF